MAYASRRSLGSRSPPLSQDEDSADEPEQVNNTEEPVQFNEMNGRDGFLLREAGTVVRVYPSNDHQLSEQSKFRFKVVVDYGWEQQYMPGRLLATHIGNKFVAYILKVNNVGAVRIIDLDTKERCLMKVDNGLVKDVEFMHKADDLYIGYVDEFGTFYINRIHKESQTGKLTTHLVFKVSLDGPPKKSEFRRFIWCKFVPDELSEVASIKDCAYQFAVLLDDMIYAGNLVQMASNHDEGAYTVNELRDDLIIIDTHSGPVTDASFAPDGTALATASKDGTVKFFQIYFQDKDGNPPRCLYSWEPHEGRPIDRLMFLDNHSIRPSAESQYWKFMITCTENMTEMKLFTCKTWTCLQTIHFSESGQWKMEIDITAHYLLATDISRKAMYLLHFEHDEETARVDWIREFSLPFNVLSFNLAHATGLRMKDIRARGLSEYVSGDPEDYQSDADLVYLEANMVNPKSLQQGILVVDPPIVYSRPNGHRISFQPHVQYQEVSKDVEVDEPVLADDEEDDDETLAPPSLSSNKSATKISPLMGREDTDELQSVPVLSLSNLSGTRKKTSISPVIDNAAQPVATSVAQMSVQLSSLIGISPQAGRPPSSGHGSTTARAKSTSPAPARLSRTGMDEFMIPREIIPGANGNVSKASSSSSPSREVEEILSPKINDIITHRSEATMEGMLSMKPNVSKESLENGNLPQLITTTQENHYPKPVLKQKQNLTNDDVLACRVAEQVTSMMDMMNLQAAEMQDLKREIGRLNGTLKQSDDVRTLHKLVEACFKDNQLRMNRLEETIKKVETQDRSVINQAANNPIPANLADVLAVSIGNVVKKEIHDIVPGHLERLFEPSRMNVQAQIDQLSTIMEANMTKNIAHIFQREKIWESVTNNFKTTAKTIFEQTFDELFTNTMFPRCQNAASDMLSQVNETFSKGTNEYLTQLENVMEKERKKENVTETIRSHIYNMQDALSSALQVEVEAQMLRVISGLQGSVVRQIEESLSRELAHAFQEQKKYFEISVLPRTVTPAVSMTDHHAVTPSNDPVQLQRHLLAMAKNGEVVTAFVQACNFGDLQVLMYLCKNMNPAKVFESKLPHQTHVSILQQMATDIQHDTETKLAYLNTAIGSLDTSDRKTLQSVGRVLPVFQASVAKFVATNPDSKLVHNIKLLEMALMGLSQQMTASQVQGSQGKGQPMGSQHNFSQF
ncbi:unnamed protein product [Orchesella dallaii]|uniref:Enhancer of mRNA-decapping protein 4 n=1 Tax=Orchesella dallaii TaxID=48710 RepID=A0ABP1Q4S7_9HEXA